MLSDQSCRSASLSTAAAPVDQQAPGTASNELTRIDDINKRAALRAAIAPKTTPNTQTTHMELSRSTARAKRSCAEKGYVVDAFAPMFSEDTHTRTDPIMHRGYYARFRGVDLAVRAFLSKFGDSAQLVVLGCGLDSMFWRLHATLDTPPTYFEVDSEVVCVAKRRIVRAHPALLNAAGAGGLGAAGALAPAAPATSSYRLVAADLRDVDALDTSLRAAGLDAAKPTLVLCECVLAYLDPERGDALVAWSRRTFAAACLFVAYDVVAPKTGDAFGRVMLSNFKDRGAPLLGAAESLDAVRGRFGDYEASDVRDMRAVYEALVLRQPAELRRISALEIFDDPDEFNLIMAHYCFALAGSGAAVDVARGLAAQLDAA